MGRQGLSVGLEPPVPHATTRISYIAISEAGYSRPPRSYLLDYYLGRRQAGIQHQARSSDERIIIREVQVRQGYPGDIAASERQSTTPPARLICVV